MYICVCLHLYRYIVGLSRARLGCFVIGSARAVTEQRRGSSLQPPAHWQRCLTLLRSTETSLDYSEVPDVNQVSQGPQMGQRMLIVQVHSFVRSLDYIHNSTEVSLKNSPPLEDNMKRFGTEIFVSCAFLGRFRLDVQELRHQVKECISSTLQGGWQSDESDRQLYELWVTKGTIDTPSFGFVHQIDPEAKYIDITKRLIRTENGCHVLGIGLKWNRVAYTLRRLPESDITADPTATKDACITRVGELEAEHKRIESQTNSNADDLGFEEDRIGQAFPICCPRHWDSRRAVTLSRTAAKGHTNNTRVAAPRQDKLKHTEAFPTHHDWNSFCNLPCPYILPGCGHRCAVPCHSPTRQEHTNKCVHVIDSPCSVHPNAVVKCHQVFTPPVSLSFPQRLLARHQVDSKTSVTASLKSALSKYQCKEMVDYVRPECGHVEQLQCHRHELVCSGKEKLLACTKRVGDYNHPECGHVTKTPTCSDRRQWEKKPLRCLKSVEYARPCGCKSTMKCHVRNEEQKKPSECHADCNLALPRYVFGIHDSMKEQERSIFIINYKQSSNPNLFNVYMCCCCCVRYPGVATSGHSGATRLKLCGNSTTVRLSRLVRMRRLKMTE